MDAATGWKVAAVAASVAADYRERGVKYKYGKDASNGGKESDCSHYVADVFEKAGVDFTYSTCEQIVSGKGWASFVQVPANDARAGDIIIKIGTPGGKDWHMGIFTGAKNRKGEPMGVQMGNHGSKSMPWGPGSWEGVPPKLQFYRPKLLVYPPTPNVPP